MMGHTALEPATGVRHGVLALIMAMAVLLYLDRICLAAAAPAIRAAFDLSLEEMGCWRDGKRAVASARKACELTNWEHPSCLEVLAAAYAECGDFEAAKKWQQTSIEKTASDEGAKMRAQELLKCYEAGKPYSARTPESTEVLNDALRP
jgi:hypothetical protein